MPHPPPTTLIYSLFSLYFCNELNYLILEEKKRIRVVILNKKFHKIRLPVLKRGSEMTEMSNLCLKQSQGLMPRRHVPTQTSLEVPPPSPPGQSDDSFHIERLKISEKRNKEHWTGKPGIPTLPPSLNYIFNAYLVAWEHEKLLFISNKILFIIPQLLSQNVSKMIRHRFNE